MAGPGDAEVGDDCDEATEEKRKGPLWQGNNKEADREDIEAQNLEQLYDASSKNDFTKRYADVIRDAYQLKPATITTANRLMPVLHRAILNNERLKESASIFFDESEGRIKRSPGGSMGSLDGRLLQPILLEDGTIVQRVSTATDAVLTLGSDFALPLSRLCSSWR